MHSGWISIITNARITNASKVFCSDETPETVVQALDASGASPSLYSLDYKLFLKTDLHFIMQNIRRAFWGNHNNLSHGWFSITVPEAVSVIRGELSSFIIDRLSHCEHDLYATIKVIQSVIPIQEKDSHVRGNDLCEVQEISKIVAREMINGDWLHQNQIASTLNC